MKAKRDLEFLYEIGTLRHVARGWVQHLPLNPASDLEHTMRVMFMALMLARKEGVKNEELIMKMALIHDVAETRTGDQSYIQKVYVEANEDKATHDLLTGTELADFEEIAALYSKRECIEAKIVKDADNLDIDLELKEFDEQGHKLPAKWLDLRTFVRNEKLYTDSAKKMWDEIQQSDPSSWHMLANKWHKLPKAGK